MKTKINADGTVTLELSQEQHTDAGKALRCLYYHTNLLDLFDSGNRTGYPHNGVRHTLSLLRVKPQDVAAWLDLVEEQMGAAGSAFVSVARTELAAVC